MASVREQILSAIEATLKAAPAPAWTIERSRLIAFSRKDGISLWIEPVQDTPSEVVSYQFDWELIVRIGVIARGPVPDQIADPVLIATHARLMANPGLGGLAYDLMPGTSTWQLLDVDGGGGVVTSEYRVRYRTPDLSIG